MPIHVLPVVTSAMAAAERTDTGERVAARRGRSGERSPLSLSRD